MIVERLPFLPYGKNGSLFAVVEKATAYDFLLSGQDSFLFTRQ